MQVMKSLSDFCKDRMGNIGVLAAGMIPALVVLGGAGIDYARAEQIRQKMQHAVDTAVLAVSNSQLLEKKSPDQQVYPFLETNLQGIDAFQVTDITIEQDGGGTAHVTVTGKSRNFFLQMIGFDEFTLSVDAEAQYNREEDVEIAVILDNSQSMLIGATKSDISTLEDEYGCAFVCHYDGVSTKAYNVGASTRLDAALTAVDRAFKIADDSEFMDKADIYFDINTFNRDMQDIADGTATKLLGAAGDPVRNIRSAPHPSSHKYEMTNFKQTMATALADAEKRKADNPDRQHFMLIITDGVSNYRDGKRKIHQWKNTYCNDVKALGIRVGVIYTTYYELPSNKFWRRKVKPFNDQIGPALEACASPGWFFEAEEADDIDAALRRLMTMAIPRPRLTN